MVAVERQQQNRDRMMAESLKAMESEACFHRALVLSILLPSTRRGMALMEGILNKSRRSLLEILARFPANSHISANVVKICKLSCPNVPNQISVAGVTALNDGLNHLNSTTMADSNPSSDQKLGVINSSSIDDDIVHSFSVFRTMETDRLVSCNFLLSPSECPTSEFYAVVIDDVVAMNVNYLPNVLSTVQAAGKGAFLILPSFDKILSICTAKRLLGLAPKLVKQGCLKSVETVILLLRKPNIRLPLLPIITWGRQPIGDGLRSNLSKASKCALDIVSLVESSVMYCLCAFIHRICNNVPLLD
ncbi:hypothetical protein GQ457_07G014600 [Hibiscus cannabinus]